MKLSLIQSLYEQTHLGTLPREIKREIFDILNIGEETDITEELIEKVNKEVDNVLKEKGLFAITISNYLGISYNEDDFLGEPFFKDLLENYNSERIKRNCAMGEELLGLLQGIERFNFHNFVDVKLYSIIENNNVYTIEAIVKYLNIKNIEELSSIGFNDVLNFHKNEQNSEKLLKEIKILEQIFGIKMTLEKANAGWIKLFSEISDRHSITNFMDSSRPDFFVRYYEIFNLQEQRLDTKENLNKAMNIFNFFLLFDSIYPSVENLKIYIKEIETKVGFEINFNSFSENNFSTFLLDFVREIHTKNGDKEYAETNNEPFNENSEEYKYSRFFDKFPKYSEYGEDGKLVEEKWNPEEDFNPYSAKYEKILHSIKLNFINLFIDEQGIENIGDIFCNKGFIAFYNEETSSFVQENMIMFIEIIKKLGVNIQLKDVDKSMATFSGIGRLVNNTIKGFFDEEISGPEYFYDKKSMEAQVLLKDNYLYENLKLICEKYDLNITISNFKRLENTFNKKFNTHISFGEYFNKKYTKIINNFIEKSYNKDGQDGNGEGIKLMNLIRILVFAEKTILTENNINNIVNNPKGVYFGYFIEAIKEEIEVEDNDGSKLLVTKENFLDFMENNDILLTFEKDAGFKSEGIAPWSKAWFLQKPERKEYLSPENISTFKKFGTIIGLGLIEGTQDSDILGKFYEHIFNQIDLETSRSSILQLGEVFNLILKKEKYELLDELVDNEINIGNEFKTFIEEHNISDKGKTILTLMITNEINSNFQIFNDENGNKQINNSSVKQMLLQVFSKFMKYKPIIDIYKKVPIKTSIGIEIEVTESVAEGYKAEVNSDYKNDIEILSEYSGIAKGNDAVHEIATKPTNNPYLLLLELKLLQDLDFLDLNFKKQNYSKGARGLHITLGGEFGIKLDKNTNFIQNVLVSSNLGGINAGKNIGKANNYSEIREKGTDCEAIFSKEKTTCTEYRDLSIDKVESFERLVISTFNLSMYKQLIDKYKRITNLEENDITKVSNEAEFMILISNKLKIATLPGQKESFILENHKELLLIYNFLTLRGDIKNIIINHNNHFLENEIITKEKEEQIGKLFSFYNSTGPIIKICNEHGINVDYFKELFESGINDKKSFVSKLYEDGKIKLLSQRQINILYLRYKHTIKPNFEKLKEVDLKIYKNLGKYLNGNIEETQRKITNRKRFNEVINGDKEYIDSLNISFEDFSKEITPDLINTFTKINNLFIKKDSINALAMLDTTREANGELITDSNLTETMIFDKIDRGLTQRKGYNVIQGASEQMLTQAIQKRILEFNEEVVQLCTEKNFQT